MLFSNFDNIKEKIKRFIFMCRTKSRKNIIYIPGFSCQNDYQDQYIRMVWYVHPIIEFVDKIFIPIDEAKVDINKGINIPDYMDTGILKFEHFFRNKIVYFDCNDVFEWRKYLEKAQISLTWNVNDKPHKEEVHKAIDKNKSIMRNWRVDKRNVQYEASFYLKLSMEGNTNYNSDLKESQEKFSRYYKKINEFGYDKSYIFGTGPSLGEAQKDKFNFDDGLTIACNSMVKNRELLKKIQPKIFVAADPIFHAGCSSYAEEFRTNLLEAMGDYKRSFLVVPFRDYVLYIKNLPSKFLDRIVGVPLEHIKNTNFNLIRDFRVKSTPNVLTLFLIPLATTFSKNIYMMGYDGRKIKDNSYFWEHNKEAQFNEQMDNIKIAHPSFFDIDYNDYYLEHCTMLENVLLSGENKGFSFTNLTKSYIPALSNRYGEKITSL